MLLIDQTNQPPGNPRRYTYTWARLMKCKYRALSHVPDCALCKVGLPKTESTAALQQEYHLQFLEATYDYQHRGLSPRSINNKTTASCAWETRRPSTTSPQQTPSKQCSEIASHSGLPNAVLSLFPACVVCAYLQ